MEDKVCVVTGANAGIGFETTRALADKGAEVWMICRNPDKGAAARQAIMEETGNDRLHLIQADLSLQDEIRRAADQIGEVRDRIDVLVNNAGTWYSQRTFTPDGVETVFAVNQMAYFLLTRELYPALQQADDARVVCVGSDSHFKGQMNFEDLSLGSAYHGLKSYAQSKLANVLFTYEFDRRKPHDHVSINCVQPGLVFTDIGMKHTTWLHSLAWNVRRTFWKSKTPAEGAATSIFLATDPEVGHQSGKYWDDCKPKPSSPESYKEEDAARLWEVCMELSGMERYFPVGS